MTRQKTSSSMTLAIPSKPFRWHIGNHTNLVGMGQMRSYKGHWKYEISKIVQIILANANDHVHVFVNIGKEMPLKRGKQSQQRICTRFGVSSENPFSIRFSFIFKLIFQWFDPCTASPTYKRTGKRLTSRIEARKKMIFFVVASTKDRVIFHVT